MRLAPLVAAGFAMVLPPVAAAPPALEPLELDPRLELTLWPSEPQVVDPVAICWDASGRAYVAECRDYPYGAGPDGAVGSTIRLLEDSNGDGVADRSLIFARDLSYVTSVTPWRGGVLVTAAPDLLFLKDTDGDGIADVREVVLTGFTRGVSDSLVNGLRFGPDNRIHGANGGNSGGLTSPKRPGHTLRLGGDDFAFDPDTGVVERTGASGGGFGLVFDGFGRAFTTYNIDHIQHRYLLRRHAERYPGFPPVDFTESISDHGEMSRIFPVSQAQTRPNHPEQAGHFSAAGGLGYLDSPVFPSDLRGSVLVGDVVGNLLHRDVVNGSGPGFVASRAPEEAAREFVAARDSAVRPVAAEVGPDGALYVLDMQRDVIEHPDYIPEVVRRQQDVRAGEDRGRIHRLAPKGFVSGTAPKMESVPDPALVPHLAHANPWWRQTARRLLLERSARGTVPAIQELVRTTPVPEGRVEALWTLQGLGALDVGDLKALLGDPHPGVRENALLASEPMLAAQPELRSAVLDRLGDPEARVRFQAALTAGAVQTEFLLAPFRILMERDVDHRWTRRAIYTSLDPEATVPFLSALLERPPFHNGVSDAHREAVAEVAALAGARSPGVPDAVGKVIVLQAAVPDPATRTAILDGLADGLLRSGVRPDLGSEARAVFARPSWEPGIEELRALSRVTQALGLPQTPGQLAAAERAREDVMDPSVPLETRVALARLLGLGPEAGVTNTLVALLDAREPLELQRTALAALASVREPALASALVDRWRRVSPAARGALLALLLDRRPFHGALLAALEDGRLTVGELNLDLEQRRRLLRGGTDDIRERASRFFGDEEYSNRRAVVTEWMARLPERGDPDRGRDVFVESCARCHAAGPVGHRVGPDLTGVAHRSVEDLLSNILDPNMAINPGFVACTVETDDGEEVSGLLQAETPEAITLLQAEGRTLVFPRRSVVRIESSGLSLMPEGLEEGRSPQDLRDLIAFLQESR